MILKLIKNVIVFFYNKKNSNKLPTCIALKFAKKTHNVVAGDLTIIDESSNVGDYSYIGRFGKITKSTIGRYCSIGDNVVIGPGEHDINASTLHRIYYGSHAYDYLTKKECIIGNDVWIGAGSIILRGVTIGNGAVIGAASVVTKNVEAYSVVAGVPAKKIKNRLPNKTMLKLENDQWWELNINEADMYHKKLND